MNSTNSPRAFNSARSRAISCAAVIFIHGPPEIREEQPENLEELILWYRDTKKTSLKDAVQLISKDL
ncbi:MAG: hypothetical protein D3907_04270, partial [Candidatus Electrothrix sp. AUS3]|nr:hypothetical protein [Candidatus Electrothrix gigas]